MEKNSNKAFILGLTSLVLLIIIVSITKFANNSISEVASIIIGFLTLSIGVLSIIGFIKSIKGIKEPNSDKKIIGMFLNFGFILFFIFVIISYIADVLHFFLLIML